MSLVRALWLPLVILVGFASASISAAEPTREELEFFEKKVRPILVEHCFKCHGTEKPKGKLSLNSKAGLLKGGETGKVVVAGDPDKSPLIHAVRYDDPELKMPPTGKLPAEHIAALTAWVKMGAPWPDDAGNAKVIVAKDFNLGERKKHWAYQPLRDPPPPKVKNQDWVRNPIDAFILAKLEDKGLTPAAPAAPAALIRRMTFDLIGLPPTPAEIAAFEIEAGKNPQAAVENLADRLLASPHYAERWARHWLDLVRYAETYGHEFDFEVPNAWHYRDYVIRALQADVPYDQFVREHIAGDLLPKPRRDAKTSLNESVQATAFWWLGEAKHSPVDARSDQADRVDNQLDVFGKTFLGLTVACARCHDHKFDAISTKDYYALAGYIQSSRQDLAMLDEPAQRRQRWESQRLLQEEAYALAREETLAHLRQAKDFARPALERLLEDKVQDADFVAQRKILAARLEKQKQDHAQAMSRVAVLAEGKQGDFERWLPSGEAFALRPSQNRLVLNFSSDVRAAVLQPPWEASAGAELVGALRSPSFVIPKKLIHYRMKGKNLRVNLVLNGLKLIQNPIYGGLTFTVNTSGDKPAPKDRWDPKPALFNPHVETQGEYRWHTMDVGMWVGQRAYIEILDDGDGYGAIERVVCSDEGAPPEAGNHMLLDFLQRDNATSFAQLSDAWQKLAGELLEQWANGKLWEQKDAPDRVDILNRVLRGNPKVGNGLLVMHKLNPASEKRWEALLEQGRKLNQPIPRPSRALAMADGSAVDEFVFIRGNHKKLGDPEPRHFLEVFGGLDNLAPQQGSGRFELAQHMIDPNRTPLTPRVMVNRLWKHHFGEGIVRSVDDFGLLGQMPTHPELLDHLATQFIKNGWSLKKMHRMMVLSNAYQMSSVASAQALEKDADNRLLSRMPLRRLEAEAIRDALLAVSGRLDGARFGPPVPPNLTSFMVGRGRPGVNGPLDGNGRRSIYLGVRRNFLNPMFLAFDYPTPFSTMGKRSVSNVPAQALTMLNNPLVVQQAEVWAKKLLAEKLTTPQRIEAMYVGALGRPPTAAEVADATAFLVEQGRLEDIRPWADLGHVIFNLKEFIFVQ